MDGVPALDLWNLIVTVLHGNTNQSKQVQGNLSTSLTRKKIPGKIDDLNSVDFVSSNANSFRQEAMLYILLFDRINLDRKIQIKYIDTKNQFAAILPREISHVMSGTIFCVYSTLAISAPSTASKRSRKEHKKVQVKKETHQNQGR